MVVGPGSAATTGAVVSFTGMVFESVLQQALLPQLLTLVLHAETPSETFPPQPAVTVNVIEVVPCPLVIVPPEMVQV